ncbi:MAG: signal peptidase II [Syntrophales bacterium]
MMMCLVSLPCIGCDQATKQAALWILPETGTLSFLGDMVRVQLVQNPGGFLSLGASLPEPWRLGLFLIGVGGLLLGILVFALWSKAVRPFELLAISLFFAGGAGNLLDRVLYGGSVVDFVRIGAGSLRTGFFNFADVAITAGALVWIAGMMLNRHREG